MGYVIIVQTGGKEDAAMLFATVDRRRQCVPGRQAVAGRAAGGRPQRPVACLIMLVGLAVPLLAGGGKAVANQPPVADAGPDRYLGADPIVLDGTRSHDPDPGDSLFYEWTQVSGPTAALTGADTATPTVDVAQTSAIQTVVLRLIVHDGEPAYSTPDTVTVKVVPAVTTSMTMTLENPPFDPNKPTFVYFGGGNCNTGGGYWGGGEAWTGRANIISWSYATPYERCGDMLIVYLSSVAPEYDQPIQTAGFSTGGMPAMDAALWINMQYQDPRYAVNRIALLDGACRDYSTPIQRFVDNPVGDEPAWVENFYVANAGYAGFRARAVNIHMLGSHGTAVTYYYYSTDPDMFATGVYNHGLVASAFTSVLEHGRNYRIRGLYSSPYHFDWIGDTSQGHMEYYNQGTYPGALPEPVTLLGPSDGAVVSLAGVTLHCGPSENAVAYDVMVARENGEISTVFSAGSPPALPTGFLPPSTILHWTIQARDAFGSSYRADRLSFVTAPGNKADVNIDGEVDANDCSIVLAAIGKTWGQSSFNLAADYDGSGVVDCRDHFVWLADYRAYHQDEDRPDPCGEETLDADGDGVADLCDRCSGTVPGCVVDDWGCPLDVPGDHDRDGDVDQADFGYLQTCLTGPLGPLTGPECADADLDGDDSVDSWDVSIFLGCASGSYAPADPQCAE